MPHPRAPAIRPVGGKILAPYLRWYQTWSLRIKRLHLSPLHQAHTPQLRDKVSLDKSPTLYPLSPRCTIEYIRMLHSPKNRYLSSRNTHLFRQEAIQNRDLFNSGIMPTETLEEQVKYSRNTRVTRDEQERFVLLLDIMGFSAFIQNTPFDEAKEKFETFREKLDTRAENLLKREHIHIAFFSDSILVTTQTNKAQDLNLISKAAAVLMQVSFECGFALKGCLAHGKFYYHPKKRIFFGLPLVNAYQLGDQEIKYYGIIVHHTAERKIRDLNKPFTKLVGEKDKTQGNNPYVYSEVPLKSSGWSCHCHLAWNLYDNKLESPIDNWSTCEKYLQQIELTVSGAPRIYIDNTRRVMLKDLALYEAEKKKAETNNQPVIFPIREELTTTR